MAAKFQMVACTVLLRWRPPPRLWVSALQAACLAIAIRSIHSPPLQHQRIGYNLGINTLYHSRLIRGMLFGVLVGTMLSALGILTERMEWLILIWIGAGVGLLVGLLLEVVSQIDQAHEKRIRDWIARARK